MRGANTITVSMMTMMALGDSGELTSSPPNTLPTTIPAICPLLNPLFPALAPATPAVALEPALVLEVVVGSAAKVYAHGVRSVLAVCGKALMLAGVTYANICLHI